MPSAEALAVLGEDILHAGTDEETLALAGPETQLIDLGGRALLPGFVDPHNHIFGAARQAKNPQPYGTTFEEAQQYLLRGGTTAMGGPGPGYPPPGFAAGFGGIDDYLAFALTGDLRIRTNLYPKYNTNCGELWGEGQYLNYPPILDSSAMLRIRGVKFYEDGGSCNLAAFSFELPEDLVSSRGLGDPRGDLFVTEEELTSAILKLQAAGYQAVIHAVGDRAIETALNSIENALGGQPNTYRHRIDHNSNIHPDDLSRYGEIGVVAVIFGHFPTCVFEDGGGVQPRYGEAVNSLSSGGRSLLDANPGLHLAWHSDARGVGVGPIPDLYSLVTRRWLREDGVTVCQPPDRVAAEALTVEEALRIMTIGSAYAVYMEDKIGSLEPGKFADLIILSDNPLMIDPDTLIDLEVLMTMVGGRVEYCGQPDVCPAAQEAIQSTAEPPAESATETMPDASPSVILTGQSECGEGQECYEVTVTCQGLASRDATVRASHLSGSKGAVVSVGGGYTTGFYGGRSALELQADGYETYQLLYQGELGYFTGVIGAGLKNVTCSTSELIKWIASDLADNPNVMGAHSLSAGSMQLGYGLAVYGLGDILDVVVLAAGPIHSDLVNTCFTYSSPARGLVLDYAHDWVGKGDYCQNGSGPDSIIPILEADSIVSPDPAEVRKYHYPRAKVVFIEGEEDVGNVALARVFYDAITSEKTWIVLPGVGHIVPRYPSGADAILEELFKGLGSSRPVLGAEIDQNLPEFGDRVDLGLIEHPDLVEASGLVDSRKNEHVLWTHNDRLRENALFAINTAGEHLGTYWIDGIENVDWEGLAIGPGPEPGVDYLYIGEIGNNRMPRDDIMYIYRIPEPVVDFSQSPVEITLFGVDTIAYQYPDGSRDAEALLLDPLTKDLYVISKRGETLGDTGVYRAHPPHQCGDVSGW